MNILKSFLVSVALIPALAFAQAPALNLPSAGITPDSPFYFLDKLGEAIQEFFTFNQENKAKLQVEFAAERIAEIKFLMDTKGVEAKGLDVAQERLQANIVRASEIMTKEKEKGVDVKALAQSINEGFASEKDELENIFKDKENIVENQKKSLESLMEEAQRSGDMAKAQELLLKINQLEKDKKSLEQERESQKDAMENEREKMKKEMEIEDAPENADENMNEMDKKAEETQAEDLKKQQENVQEEIKNQEEMAKKQLEQTQESAKKAEEFLRKQEEQAREAAKKAQEEQQNQR